MGPRRDGQGLADTVNRSIIDPVSWRNRRLQPKSAVSRLPPVHWVNLEGPQRVDVTRSPRSDEWPLLREPNDWRHREGDVQTATMTAASRRTIGALWSGKIPANRGRLPAQSMLRAGPIADGRLAFD